jgi:hypothetical protein
VFEFLNIPGAQTTMKGSASDCQRVNPPQVRSATIMVLGYTSRGVRSKEQHAKNLPPFETFSICSGTKLLGASVGTIYDEEKSYGEEKSQDSSAVFITRSSPPMKSSPAS